MDGGSGTVERGRVTVENRQSALEVAAGLGGMLEQVGGGPWPWSWSGGCSGDRASTGRPYSWSMTGASGRCTAEFFGDPSATDVITFPMGNYGEILVSVETARRQAAELGVPWEREMALYVVHGLLHLCGYEDQSAEGARRMAELQDAIVVEVY